MKYIIWRRWVSRLFLRKRSRPTRRLHDRRSLGLESLEDRLVPSTDIWTGLGTGVNSVYWSNPQNWSNQHVPVAGDDIVFDSTTAPIKNTRDDISLPSGGFDSITFSASGYTVTTQGTTKLILTGSTPLTASQNLGLVSGTEPTISGTLVLAPAASSPQQTIQVGADTVLDIAATLSGNSAAQSVLKTQTGTLELDGNNTGYQGGWNLQNNGGVVLVTNGNALGTGTAVSGAPNAGVATVNANTQIQVGSSTGNISVPEQLILNGFGFSNNGAILNVAGNNTWAGTVTMDSSSYFGSNAGTTLTFANTVTDAGVQATVTKVGYGTITFAAANSYRGQTIINNGILAIENPLALGAGANSSTAESGTTGSATIVNYNANNQTFGTLEINYVSGVSFPANPTTAQLANAILEYPTKAYNKTTNPIVGFQVFKDLLVLNGPGDDLKAPGGGSTRLGSAQDYLGSLYNAGGSNAWDGSVILGDDVSISNVSSSTADPVDPVPAGGTVDDVFIGAATSSSLNIEGQITEPATTTPILVKVQPGQLILSNANTFTGGELYDYATKRNVLTGTLIAEGDVMITDSTALGSSAVTVEDLFSWPAGQNDAALEMAVDSGLDGTSQNTQNVNLGYDSITGSGQGVLAAGLGSEQQFTVPTTATGTFTLSFEGQTTSSLAYNATAAQVQTALDSLSDVSAAGGATVTEATVVGTGDVYTVLFDNIANADPTMTLTGSAFSATVEPIANTDIAQVIYVPASTTAGSTFTLKLGANTTGNITVGATAAQVQTALNALASVQAVGDATVSQDGDVYRVVFGDTTTSVPLMTFTSDVKGSNPAASIPGFSLFPVANTGSGQEIYIPTVPPPAVGQPTPSFTLTLEGYTTYALPYNASATVVAAALNTLPSVTSAGGALVTQDGNVYRVIFGTSLSPNVPLMTIATSGISGTSISPIYGLNVQNPIIIAGSGVNKGGALDSVSGINSYGGAIQVGNAFQVTVFWEFTQFPNYVYDLTGSIGVNLDNRPGHATADSSYANFDYNLTLPNRNELSFLTYQFGQFNGLYDFDPVQYTTLTKEGAGQLVIANSNDNDTLKTNTNGGGIVDHPTYIVFNTIKDVYDLNALAYCPGPTVIAAGWITVETNNALGDTTVNPLLSSLLQPDSIQVDSGASLQLLPPIGSNITLGNNLILQGLGIPATTASTAGINFNMLTEGAIVSLGGDNLLTGTIQLWNTAGIGVDDPILSDYPSQSILTITGEMEDYTTTNLFGVVTDYPGGIEKLGTRELIIQGPGTYTGSNLIESGTVLLQNSTGLGEDTTGTGLSPAPGSIESYSTTTTTVGTGALLELGDTSPTYDGGISSSVQIDNEQLVLNGGGQQLNISGSGGAFTLSYTNPTTGVTDTTASINVASTTLASDIQTALNALANIGGFESSSVSVLSSGITGLFTVVFNGALASVANPLLVATPSASPGNATVTVDGSPFPIYALDDNTWTGGVTMNAAAGAAEPNTTFEVANNARLIIQGTITGANTDSLTLNAPINTFSTASNDNGELVLSGTNTYNGTTYVNAGILTVASNQALGLTGAPEEQAVQLPIGAVGTFTLNFEGYTTSSLNASSLTLASDIQKALDLLPSILEVGGSVDVAKSLTLPNTYVVTFDGGSLASFQLPLMSATSPTLSINITEVQAGYGGVIVSTGAQMQIEGNLTIAGKSLELSGTGQSAQNTPSTIPITWQQIGPSPIDDTSSGYANGTTATSGDEAIAGRVTGVVTDPSDPNVIYISTVGGGAWRTINDGLTWTPLFDGVPEIQTITVNTLGSFTLTFGGNTTSILSGSSQTLALKMQNALDALNSVGGAGGNVQVTQSGNTFIVTFGGALVENWSTLANHLITANVATSLVSIAETQVGLPATVAEFCGAIAIDPNNVATIYLGTGEADNSGDSFYGTGVYVSYNYGGTWSLLAGTIFNPTKVPGNTITGDPSSAVGNPLYGDSVSAIAVDPNHKDTIYVSVSDDQVNDPNPDNGTAGVWRFIGMGESGTDNNGNKNLGWTNLTSIVSWVRQSGAYDNSNEPDPYMPDNAMVGNLVNDNFLLFGGRGPEGNIPGVPFQIKNAPPPDIFPITTSGFQGPGSNYPEDYIPGTPGPDDNFSISFPSDGVYSSVTFGATSIPFLYYGYAEQSGPVDAIYIAIGNPGGAAANGVYRLPDPFNASQYYDNEPNGASTTWYIGDGNPWSTSASSSGIALTIKNDYGNPSGSPTSAGAFPITFPEPGQGPQFGYDNYGDPLPDGGNIKITTVGEITYAAVTWADGNIINFGNPQFEYLFVSTNGGYTWQETGSQPPNYMNTQGDFDSTIVANPNNPNDVFVLGCVNYGAGPSGLVYDGQAYGSINGGATWNDISIGGSGDGPHTDEHASTIDANGNLIAGGDGGVWEYDITTQNWIDLNGNLAISTENSVATEPGNPQNVIAGTQDDGTILDNPGATGVTAQAWALVDTGDGGDVAFDPQNPLIAYHVTDGALYESTNGGESFGANPIYTNGGLYFPFTTDLLNTNRLVVGGARVDETVNGGATWRNLNAPYDPYYDEQTSVAVATYQGEDGANGTFVPDPSFPDVGDQGADTYVPGTIYVVGIAHAYDQATGYYEDVDQGLFVTKNDGETWSPERSPLLTSGKWPDGATGPIVSNPTAVIENIVVDPQNEDTIFAVIQDVDGGANAVMESTNAGQTWTNITSASIGTTNLPNEPFWSLAFDPRDNELYLGTDTGVYAAQLDTANPAQTTWSRYGSGLPDAQVTSLDLDMTTNTLTAGTYGRSTYQLNLNDPQANSGALRVVAGSSTWTGPIRLAGATTISTSPGALTLSTSELQSIQNLPEAQVELNIQGIISDTADDAGNALTTTGEGTFIFSGDNTYSGSTTVDEGVLVANNFTALGDNTAQGTTVENGASLELSANLDSVPVTLIGNGISFNSHYTGALRNVTGNNTFTGNITLESSGTDNTVTIDADSGTEMTLNGSISGTATGGLIKEGTGTVVLDDESTTSPNNTYTATTYVYQGVLEAESSSAFGVSTNTVKVLDGAQVQVQTPATDSIPVNIPNPLILSGTGIFGTGALLGVGLDSASIWSGTITFEILPGFAPLTAPVGTVAIGVNEDDTLTLSGAISSPGGTTLPIGLLKVGAGVLAVDAANTYTGQTEVQEGILELQSAGALGDRSSAFPTLNTVQEVVTDDANATQSAMFTISFDGIREQFKYGTAANTVRNDFTKAGGLFAQAGFVNALGVVDASVAVTRSAVNLTNEDMPPGAGATSFIYTLSFGGAAATTNIPVLVTGLNGVAANSGIVGAGNVDALVDSGAQLALDSAAGITIAGHKVTLNGDGPAVADQLISKGAGALFNYVGNNTWSGPIELASNSQIGVSSGTVLSLSGTTTSDAPFYAPNVDTLEKVDPGLLIYTSTGVYAGYIIVTGGGLQVDGTVGTYGGVYLNGGVLSGNGTVGLVSDDSTGASPGGTIDPGDNSPSESTGALTLSAAQSYPSSSLDSLTPEDEFFVDLTSSGADLMSVADTSLALGGATLAGLVGGSIQPDQSFTILQTDYKTDASDAITGAFAGVTTTPVVATDSNGYAPYTATIDWIDNEKFVVNYFPDQVVVTRELATITSFTLAPSVSGTPLYGEDETFTATLTPEVGAPAVTGDVSFYVEYSATPSGTYAAYGPGNTGASGLYSIPINSSSNAVLDLSSLLGSPLPAGFYEVSASYNGDNISSVPTYYPATATPDPLAVQVAQTPVNVTLTPSSATPVYGDTAFSLTADVYTSVTNAVDGTLAPSQLNTAGSVLFYDGTTLLNSMGALSYTIVGAGTSNPYLQAVLTISSLQVGGHLITADYQGDSNYQPNDSSLLDLVVNKDATTTSVVASPTSPTPVYGQPVTFTATVSAASPGSGTPTGTVDFEQTLSNGTLEIIGAGQLQLVGGQDQASYIAAAGQLPVGSYPIVAVYGGDGNFLTSPPPPSTVPITVAKASSQIAGISTTAVTSSTNPSVYGQSAQLTAIVSPEYPGVYPTGTVTFTNALTSQTIATATLVDENGVDEAIATTTLLPVGTTEISASYSGDSDFAGASTGANLPQVVNQAFTSTGVSSSAPNGAVYGESVTFTATVAPLSPASGTPTGSVSFYVAEGANLVFLGTGTLGVTNQGDQAIYTTTPTQLPLALGQTITAEYSGDANFYASEGTTSQDVNLAGSTVKISSSSPSGSVYGQQVTFTATVSATPPATGTPTGSVTFENGGAPLATVSLVAGVASFTSTATQLNDGPNTITAVYNAVSPFSGNSASLVQTVSQDPTSTTVSSGGPSVYGQSVTFTATVSSQSPGGGNPEGTVNFYVTVNGTKVLLGPGTLAADPNSTTSSTALFATSSAQLSVGNDQTITAVYAGNTDYIGSQGTTSQTVSPGETQVALNSTWSDAPTNDVYGQPVTFTVTVAPVGGAIPPTGTISFSAGGTVFATGVKLSVVNGVATAVYTTSGQQLPAGLNQTITATYSGDSNYQSSTGSELQSVYPDTSTTDLVFAASDDNASTSVNVNQTVAYTATVTSDSPGSGTPSGTVTFVDETTNTVLGSSTLAANGTTTFQTRFTVVEDHSIEAVYNGTSEYYTSTSNPLDQTVVKIGARASKVTLTSSLNPAELGQSVTFTATVKDAGAGRTVTPSGTVSFMDGGTFLGTVSLSSVSGVMTAAFTTSSLPLGGNKITAVFNGNTTFAQAASAVLTETVNTVPTGTSTISVQSSAPNASYGQAVKFTATVTGLSPAQTPTGTIVFTYKTSGSSTQVVLGTETLSGSGGVASANYSTSTLPVGSYTIIATYNGNTVFAPDAPATTSQTIAQISTSSTLTSSTASGESVYGQSVTFTATVTKSAGGAAAGSVVFTNQTTGTVLGTGTLNSKGVATLKTSTLPVGANAIVVSYAGSTNIAESSQTLTQVVNQDSTSAAVSASTTQSNASLTLTATIKAVSPGSGTPTGTVSFYVDGMLMGIISLNSSGQAKLTLPSGLAAGDHTIEVDYSGDDNFLESDKTVTLDIANGRGT